MTPLSIFGNQFCSAATLQRAKTKWVTNGPLMNNTTLSCGPLGWETCCPDTVLHLSQRQTLVGTENTLTNKNPTTKVVLEVY